MVNIIAFSDAGGEIGEKIKSALVGEECATFLCRGRETGTLEKWTNENFASSDALIFVGALGICVRAIAPHVKSKLSDPAVICVDDCGKFVISVLSGHVGGANLLTNRLARELNAAPIITTSTDGNGLFAVDSFAVKNRYAIENPQMIKHVSAKIIDGDIAYYKSDFPVSGELPKNVADGVGVCDFAISVYKSSKLTLVPKILTLGIGCKKNTSFETIEQEFESLLARENLYTSAFSLVASIDIKSQEAGLLEFCGKHNFCARFYSAKQLMQVSGEFTKSDFVLETTGADNVCERAAAISGGELLIKKSAANGVTLAVSAAKFAVKF